MAEFGSVWQIGNLIFGEFSKLATWQRYDRVGNFSVTVCLNETLSFYKIKLNFPLPRAEMCATD
jgi:hypothetical protein